MQQYRLEYLPRFYKDLDNATDYIMNKLCNPLAALDLADAVSAAILNRLPNAESFEPYHSRKDRENVYYRIYVDKYVVYYVVREVDGKKVMEVRRLLHERQDREQNV